ncbi:hypothetical protein [Bosea lupini]|nr:hypothetical protein [Bosea lupini]
MIDLASLLAKSARGVMREARMQNRLSRRTEANKLRSTLYGVQGGEGESARGIKQHRCDAAVAQLVSEIERYKALAAQ